MTVNKCHVHNTSGISNCFIPQENSEGKKLMQFKANFPGIFAVSFVPFLHVNFQSYFAYINNLCNWYGTDTEKKQTTRLIINQSLRNPLHYLLIHHSRKCSKRSWFESVFVRSVLKHVTWCYQNTDGWGIKVCQHAVYLITASLGLVW